MDINLLGSAINGEQIVSIIQLATNIAFYSILGILVIAFLWGLLQGWRYGTYHMVFIGLLVALGLVTLGPVVDAISGYDLSGIITNPITVQIQEHSITVNVTTISDTLTSFFDQLLRAYGVAASSDDIVAYSQALAGSVLKLVLIFAEGIIIQVPIRQEAPSRDLPKRRCLRTGDRQAAPQAQAAAHLRRGAACGGHGVHGHDRRPPQLGGQHHLQEP